MAINLTINGTPYPFPSQGDVNWGQNATAWASAVTGGMLQKAGGSFSLTAEVDFGATFGLKARYYKSRSNNIAEAGQLRLANSDQIMFRNFENDADLSLAVNPANHLTFAGELLVPVTGASMTGSLLLHAAPTVPLEAATKKYVDDLSLAAAGGLGGDYIGSTALAAYSTATTSFLFTSATNVAAKFSHGPLTLRTVEASAKGITLTPPNSLAADFTLTLPGALPASTKILTLSDTGLIAASYDVDGSTLEVSTNTLRVKDAGVTAAKLAADAVTTVKILDANVTTPKVADSAITTAKLGDASVTTAKLVDSNVTTAKVAAKAVTNAKLADLNYVLSPSSGISAAVSTPNTIILTTPALVAIGRPVFVQLVPLSPAPGGTVASSVYILAPGASNATCVVQVFRTTGGVDTSVGLLNLGSESLPSSGTPNNWTYVAPSSVQVFDEPPAGTHTYKLVWVSGRQTQFANVKLLAREV